MSRWGMIANLERCVGCQTCTAACKHTNATSPAVQWRKVLDIEMGEYPDVKRAFVPVGCMHCEDPPCMHVCPSTATKRRDDGIVTIDYDLCIGCAYCAVACPYQARFKVDKPNKAYGKSGRMRHEIQREDPARIGVAQKCTFCSDRVDYGLENDLTPGVDPEATPACVNACIAGALHFGDLDNPESNVAVMLKQHKTFRMHEELGTNPGFHYIYDHENDEDDEPEETVGWTEASGVGGVGAAAPWLQQHWDWRAAGNFIAGGTGSGLVFAMTVLSEFVPVPEFLPLIGIAFVITGLFLVWLETGRPFRAPLNVMFNPHTSWMTRESFLAMGLVVTGLASAWFSSWYLLIACAVFSLGFLYCQGQILKAAKGIPAWRAPEIVSLIFSTGLVEGAGILLALSALNLSPSAGPVREGLGIILMILLTVRAMMWNRYRTALRTSSPVAAQKVIDKLNPFFIWGGHLIPMVLFMISLSVEPVAGYSACAAGVVALLAGWVMKFSIITRASYNQGYAINHSPRRGSGNGGPGGKPGWEIQS